MEVCAELSDRLAERPGFYRGSRANALFGADAPAAADLERLRALLDEHGVALSAVLGDAPLEPLAGQLGLAYAGPVPHADVAALPKRSAAANHTVSLSDSARSLVADFAGARSDLAARRIGRQNGTAARSHGPAPALPAVAQPAGAVATLYHRGTLRGGQALHNLGHVVVIGDVNPGAELVASGDIVVFGSLRGVAHAGAQGDAGARVIALELAPTQLRIANLIAADDVPSRAPAGPEQALVQDGRIAVVAHASAESIWREAVR